VQTSKNNGLLPARALCALARRKVLEDWEFVEKQTGQLGSDAEAAIRQGRFSACFFDLLPCCAMGPATIQTNFIQDAFREIWPSFAG
jgi:hypothetical protein